MNVSSVTSNIKPVAQKAIDTGIQAVGKVGDFTIKTASKYLKKDIVETNGFKLKDKEVIVGAAIVGVALDLAFKCVKGIVKNIKETREK